jgi:hypothetical protein
MAICQCLYLYLDEFGGEPFPMMDCNGTIIFEGFPGTKVAKGRMVNSLVDGFFVDSIMLKRDLKRDYIT